MHCDFETFKQVKEILDGSELGSQNLEFSHRAHEANWFLAMTLQMTIIMLSWQPPICGEVPEQSLPKTLKAEHLPLLVPTCLKL